MNSTKLLTLERDLSKEHPLYVSQKNAVEELDKKINDRVAGILIGLQTRLEATRARVVDMNAKLESAKTNDLTLTEKTRPYYVAKQKLYELQQFNVVLGMRIASQQTELVLPRNSPDIVVKPAALGIPVSPNRLLATVLIGLGLITGIGGRLLLRHRRNLAGV